MDNDAFPEVKPEQGGAWADLEIDSVSIDGENTKVVSCSHNFRVSMGNRKGIGSDYISFRTSGFVEPFPARMAG